MHFAKNIQKKLLILGGASVHIKLIHAAKNIDNNIFVVVTDNVPYEDSPGKQIADSYWDLDIFDIESIVDRAKKENINAVICGWLDPCQKPYQKICNKLNLPCYASEEQFFKMTNKTAFKKMCKKNGVNTIPDYSINDVFNNNIEYPVFVKPVDSRGSRGQSVCYNKEQLESAIERAKQEAYNNEIIIEKYIRDSQEFHVTYFFIDGEPHLLRTSDNYSGDEKEHMEKVVSCAVMPSKYTDYYLKTAHQKVVNMFKKLGVMNGPIFMQGFLDNGIFRFFDPGLRFPGVDFELVFKKVFDIDLMKFMINIAFGNKLNQKIPENAVYLDNNRAAVLYLTLKAGYIDKIYGCKSVLENRNIVSFLPRCKKGDIITWEYNVNQRFGEFDILCKNLDDLKDTILFINNNIKVYDKKNNSMIFGNFDIERLDKDKEF